MGETGSGHWVDESVQWCGEVEPSPFKSETHIHRHANDFFPPSLSSAPSLDCHHLWKCRASSSWTWASDPSHKMSGKRVLDALALLSVSRRIAVKHFDIRLSQAKVHAQTSSILKSIRNQGLPVLATAVSRFASSQSSSNPKKQGIQQDHFYTRSEKNSPAQPAPTDDLDVAQAKSRSIPLPDGTIPPEDAPAGQRLPGARNNKDSTAEDGQSEDQIPAKTAGPPSAEDSPGEFGVEQEQDVFYQPPHSVTPVISALPRVRIPRAENDVQEGDSHVPAGVNADVYYSGSKRDGRDADEPTEEQLSQLFNNPKHAKLLGKKARHVPGGVASRGFHTMKAAQQKTKETDDTSIEQLAADVANDARKINVSSQ